MKKTITILSSLVLLLTLAVCTLAQDPQIHPKKAHFADLQQWEKTVPGDVKLKNFKPFRAVYDRSYKQAGGPNAGEQRHDRVIVSADNVGWDGQDAIAITMLDSGDSQWDDTNARVLEMIIDAEHMSGLFELGPIPGKAKDYYIGRRTADNMVATMVTTEDGKAQPQIMPHGGAKGFGPVAWVIANMDLKEGKKVFVDRVFSPKGNPLTWWGQGMIRGKEAFESASGQKHEAWVHESFWGLKSKTAVLVYLSPQPPYFLGAAYEDLESGEKRDFLRIKEFSYTVN